MERESYVNTTPAAYGDHRNAALAPPEPGPSAPSDYINTARGPLSDTLEMLDTLEMRLFGPSPKAVSSGGLQGAPINVDSLLAAARVNCHAAQEIRDRLGSILQRL